MERYVCMMEMLKINTVQENKRSGKDRRKCHTMMDPDRDRRKSNRRKNK